MALKSLTKEELEARRAATQTQARSRPTTTNGRGKVEWLPIGDSKRRMVLSVQAPEKAGKTHFALTMPGPLGYISLDFGEEGVVERFTNDKVIQKVDIFVECDSSDPRAISDAATPVWEKCMESYRDGIRSFRSLVVDTGSEMWELSRLSNFGKLTQVMPHNYGPVNTEWRALIREAYDYNCNVALLHKMKPEWENYEDSQGREKSRQTGRITSKQQNDIPFLVQVIVQPWREPMPPFEFHTQIVDCRQNGLLKGEDLVGPMNNFSGLAQLVFPTSGPEDWE